MSCVNQELTDAIRSAIKDRALWFYLLLEEAKAQGADPDEVAKKAIFKYGAIKGARMGDRQTPREFFDGIVTKNSSLAFAMEEVSVAEDQGVYRFHACALCEAWRELGCTAEEISRLCKLAMQGDFGMVSSYPLELSFNSTIGEGAKYCEMVVTKTA